MRVMSYNIFNGGHDDGRDTRFQAILAAVRAVDPDVLLLQEARGFLHDGSARLYAAERSLGRRGFVAEAPVTGQHTAVFVRHAATPLRFESDAAHFHHAAAVLRVLLPGASRPLTAISVHLSPTGTPVRLREASYLAGYAMPDDDVILGGDFNAVSPDDPEPLGLSDLPARFQVRYADADGRADRRTVAVLQQAGFVDVAVTQGGNSAPTVPTAGLPAPEFMPFRSDYLLASPALAARAKTYAVCRDVHTHEASDHYPITAEFAP